MADVGRLAAARLASYHPRISTWQDDQAIRERIEAEVKQLLIRTTDEQFGHSVMERFPRHGVTDPSMYLDSVAQLPDGALALTGIRHRGGDPRRPFIDIMALEGDLTSDRVPKVVDHIAHMWSSFQPTCVRLTTPAADSVQLDRFGPRSRIDVRLIAGRVSDIMNTPADANDIISMKTATDLSWYRRYLQEYEQFLAVDDARRDWAQPEHYQDLEDTVREGSVLLAMHQDVLAGIYALPRTTEHGLHGFRVQEKLLFESVRGKRLGARVERLAIKQLPAAPDDVVFGTIADGNKASRRTAYRVGRLDIGAKLWLTPTDCPGMPD